MNTFQELEDIVKVCEQDKVIAKESGGNPFARMLREPAVRKAVLIGCSLQLFQQLSGINTVIYYSARILMMSGISNDVYIVLWISCGVNAINFFASFIGNTNLGINLKNTFCISKACLWRTELGEEC